MPDSTHNSQPRRPRRARTDATNAFLAGDAGRPDGLNATHPPARAAAGGGTPEELIRRSNFWRDNYNPLRDWALRGSGAVRTGGARGVCGAAIDVAQGGEAVSGVKGLDREAAIDIEQLDGRVRIREQLPAGATAALAEQQRQFCRGAMIC